MNNLIQIIEQQQSEKKLLLSKKYVPRAQAKQFQKQIDTNLIKVVVGPRRAGKSTFAINALKKKDFLYLNFDNRELLSQSFSTKDFLKAFKYFGEKYLFLDEIQNIPSFELLINTFQRNGYLQVVSGSNSNLLSGELATHLTGRFIKFEVFPFSLQELGKYKKYSVAAANSNGLFPEVVVGGVDSKLYLKDLFNSIIYKDIIQRHKLRAINDFEAVAQYLISNIGSLQSLGAISKKLNIASLSSVSKYLSYLVEGYLIIPLKKFSFKVSETIKNPSKFYCIDNGLINAISQSFSQNFGKLLENQVLLEVIKSGIPARDIFYFVSKKTGAEVDFLVKLPNKQYVAIQACATLLEDRTRDREFSAFKDLKAELGNKIDISRQILVVLKDEGYESSGVEITTLENFSLEKMRQSSGSLGI